MKTSQLRKWQSRSRLLPHGMYCVNPFDRVELPLPLPERAATPKKHRLSYDELHDTMIHAAIE